MGTKYLKAFKNFNAFKLSNRNWKWSSQEWSSIPTVNFHNTEQILISLSLFPFFFFWNFFIVLYPTRICLVANENKCFVPKNTVSLGGT